MRKQSPKPSYELYLSMITAAGLTSYRVARCGYFDPAVLYRWKSGARYPAPWMVETIAGVIGCRPEDLYQEEAKA